MLYASFLNQWLTKGHALLNARAHELEAALCHTHEAHRVLEPTRAQATLRDFEATAFALNHIGHWHTHIFEQKLCLTGRRVKRVKDA